MGESPVALVTGAAKRIGAAIARRLQDEGYAVAVHYHGSQSEAEALVADLGGSRPGSAMTIQGDVSEVADCRRIVEATVDAFGRLDLLVNNASGFYPTPLAGATEDQWDDLMGSNLKGPFFLAQAASPHLAERAGSIVNILDLHASRPLRDHPIYGVAKAGLAMLTKSLAKDLGPGVRVNGVAPGTILWPEAGLSEEEKDAIIRNTPLGRMGEPEDVAAAVVYLAGAGFVTGQVIGVDGGRGL